MSITSIPTAGSDPDPIPTAGSHPDPIPTAGSHPELTDGPATVQPRTDAATETVQLRRRHLDDDGSLITEYGLLAVVAATVCAIVIQWASGGAIVRLFNALLNAARDLVGA